MTVWNSKNGPIAVDDMTEAHAKNVLKMLIRNNMIKRPERRVLEMPQEVEDELLAKMIEREESQWGY
jgi:hypothetical protein